MRTRNIIYSILLSINFSFSTSISFAYPPVNGIPICSFTTDQQYPVVASDSAGGYFIAWQDSRNGLDTDIYAQHINSQGSTLWTQNGISICNVTGNQVYPAIANDGSGGAIITWRDSRYGNYTAGVYAQRINSNGSTLWNPNGIVIFNFISDYYIYSISPVIISDGSGGAIIAWGFEDTLIFHYILIKRINSLGSSLWGTYVTDLSDGGPCNLISDGLGGVIITYGYGDLGSSYIQRFDSQGLPVWGSTSNSYRGLLLPTGFNSDLPSAIADGSGGALVTWRDNYYISAQSINSQGTTLWQGNGVTLCSTGNYVYSPQITGDGAGGAIVTWNDYRNTTSDIFAQRINSSGSTLWTNNGITICTSQGYKSNPLLIDDGAGGSIITWTDYRSTTANPGQVAEIYSQRINNNGLTLWTLNGVAVCTAAGDQTAPMMASNGAGGSFVTWQDHRGTDWDIYSQSVSADGNILLPVNDWFGYSGFGYIRNKKLN